MHTRASLRPVARASLSEHELKRCRAEAGGYQWQVFEEDILWWSLDRQTWLPVDDAMWQRRRRWLLVEREDGAQPVYMWDVSDVVFVPAAEPPRTEAPGTEGPATAPPTRKRNPHAANT